MGTMSETKSVIFVSFYSRETIYETYQSSADFKDFKLYNVH